MGKLKKAINQWFFPAGTTAPQAIALAAKAGFEGFEPFVTVEKGDGASLQSSPQELAEMARCAQEEGIRFASLASGIGWQHSLFAAEKSGRETAKDMVRRQLGVAAKLGCDGLLLVPGALEEGVLYTDAYDYTKEALLELAPFAAQCGVSIGVENVWNRFLLSPREMLGLLREINSPYVNAYFDMGNILYIGSPVQWVEILAGHIGKVHVKDYKLGLAGMEGFVPLRTGDVPYKKVTAALQKAGYEGFLTAEIGSGSDVFASLTQAAKDMEWIVNSASELYSQLT